MAKNYIKYIRSKMGHQNIFLNFVAGAFFDKKGQLLLQKRGDTKKWGLPGGALELGENFNDALKREFHEETGLEIIPTKLIGVYTDKSHTIEYPNGDMCQPIVALYMVKSRSRVNFKMTNTETLELSFFTHDKLPGITNQQHEEMINNCFAFASPNVTRKL